MPHIAFATFGEVPGIGDDDAPAANILNSAGVAVSPVVWDDPKTNWRAFDAVVIRSTWDYHLRPQQYTDWINRLAAAEVPLWNPPAAVLDNLHKSYLTRLPSAVPTECLAAGSSCELRTVLNRLGCDQAVVKPAVSAGAAATWRASRAVADEQRFEEQLRGVDVLVQPYLPEVESPGEWSLVYFHRQYSHAVLKQPADGDFRVQEHLGGRSVPATAPADLIRQGEAILATVPGPLLYARVDGVERDGQLILTELEITEPYLYLGLADGAAERFARAILDVLAPR